LLELAQSCPEVRLCADAYYSCDEAGEIPQSECYDAYEICRDASGCPEAPSECARIQGNLNERGEYFYSMTNLTLKEAVAANASMFAYSTADAERKYEQLGFDFNLQPAIEQFFWSTMFFNAGAGTAGNRLTEHGNTYYEDKWPEGAADNWLNPLYNALWRTSTYEYLMIKVYGGLPTGN